MAKNLKEVIVLLHGLAESPLTMAPLELALRQAGYAVENEAYPSTAATIKALSDTYVGPLLRKFGAAPRVHFVTHSLGGVLLHYALQEGRPDNLGRVVMTAPGLRGSEALEAYRHIWLFRMLFGPAAYQSGTQSDAFAKCLKQEATYDLGVISGCVSLDPVANLFIPWPHDGKISVERTKIAGLKDHLVLPTSHDMIPSDPTAIAQTLRFLRMGSFFHILQRPAISAATTIAA